MKSTKETRLKVLKARLSIMQGRAKDNAAIQRKLARKIAELEK